MIQVSNNDSYNNGELQETTVQRTVLARYKRDTHPRCKRHK